MRFYGADAPVLNLNMPPCWAGLQAPPTHAISGRIIRTMLFMLRKNVVDFSCARKNAFMLRRTNNGQPQRPPPRERQHNRILARIRANTKHRLKILIFPAPEFLQYRMKRPAAG